MTSSLLVQKDITCPGLCPFPLGLVPIFDHTDEYNYLEDEGTPKWKELGVLHDITQLCSLTSIDNRDLRETYV